MHVDPASFVILPVFVLSLVIHECAHGWMALWRGDPTARDQGRLTLNPLPHLDLLGSLLLPIVLLSVHAPVLFGWARPVPMECSNLKDPRNDPVRVALAGPASNALLALGCAALARFAPASGFFAPLRDMGIAGVTANAALMIVNLIPIPPLDGSWVLMRFLRLRHILVLHQFRLLALALLVALLAVPVISNAVLVTPLRAAVHVCLGWFGVAGGGRAL